VLEPSACTATVAGQPPAISTRIVSSVLEVLVVVDAGSALVELTSEVTEVAGVAEVAEVAEVATLPAVVPGTELPQDVATSAIRLTTTQVRDFMWCLRSA
jgi:hypothetical protein